MSSQNSELAWQQHGHSGTATDLMALGSLVHAWRQRWHELPNEPVLCDADGAWITNQELAARCHHAALRLLTAGIVPGDRVLMSCSPSVALVVTHVAVLMVGAVVVPVNTGFTSAELGNVAAEADARLIVITDSSRVSAATAAAVAAVVRADLSDLPHGPFAADPSDLANRIESIGSDSPALLLFTSGTTGRPKGALLSHGNVLASATALVTAWQWSSADRLVLCLPLFHMHGLGVGVHGTLLAGASAVILPAFAEEAVFDAIGTQTASMLFGVPTMWTRLLHSPRVTELQSLRLCVSGSAALSPEVWNGLLEHAGQQVLERYGMTETVMLTSNPFNGQRKPGSVGLPLPGVEVSIHQPTADGVGELLVRGPNVFVGYLNRPEANAEAFVDDGWFRTGDLGRVDSDGYFSIVGRCKDLIISGGYNVYPSDVEAILRTHHSVAEVAVIGEPSELWGETVTACVVLASTAGSSSSPAVSEADLVNFAAQHLATYQRPRRIVFCEALPRNALGKVVKAELAHQIGRLPK